MITVDNFLTGTLRTVDGVIGQFVTTAYQQFIQANAGTITLLFTLYVMMLGYQFLQHHPSFNLNTIIKHIVLMLCVYTLIMNWKLYHLFVYRIFTTEPSNISNILVSAADPTHASKSVAEGLDVIYATIHKIASGFLGQGSLSLSGIAFVFYAFGVWCIGTAMCVFALLLLLYAKMMMAVGLALGPIFILFILWEPTKGMFSSWLNNLITIALIPIVTSTVLMLMLSVIEVTLPDINHPQDDLQFYGIAPFLGLALTTSLILTQVFRVCSTLGGGIALASISGGKDIAQKAMQMTGVATAARSLGNSARNKFQQRRGTKQ